MSSSPEIARSVVVLPAPFAPSRATILPSGTTSERPRSTRITSLYTTSTLEISSTARPPSGLDRIIRGWAASRPPPGVSTSRGSARHVTRFGEVVVLGGLARVRAFQQRPSGRSAALTEGHRVEVGEVDVIDVRLTHDEVVGVTTPRLCRGESLEVDLHLVGGSHDPGACHVAVRCCFFEDRLRDLTFRPAEDVHVGDR